MSDHETRTVVADLYSAYTAGDMARLTPMIADDIDWIIHSPVTVFPFAGPRRGRAAVLDVMARIGAAFKLESHKVVQMVVEGDRAAVLADISFTQRATGRIIRFRVANFLRIVDGRLIEFREFSDSFDLVEQALGHTVDL